MQVNEIFCIFLFQDYQIDFFFRQSWVDPRLNHSFNGMLTVSNTVLQKIWQPDTYFENSKRSTFHDVTVENKMLRIHQNGKVEYNARYLSGLFSTLTRGQFPPAP